MYHTVSIRFSTNTLLAGGLARHPQPFRRGHRARHPAPSPPDDRLPRPDAPAAHLATSRPRSRRDVRLVAPARPRRCALPRVDQAGDDGARPARRASGSSTARPRRSSRSARRTTGSSTPARWVGPVPGAGSPSPRSTRTTTPTTATSRGPTDLVDEGEGAIWCDSPTSLDSRYWRNPEATARGLARVGLHRRRPGPPRYGRLPLPDRPPPRPHHQRRRQRVPGRGRERALAAVPGVAEVAVFGLPDEQWGQRVCAAYVADAPSPRAASAEEALRAAAADRLAPYKRPKDVRRRPGPAPHRHRQAHATGRTPSPRPRRTSRAPEPAATITGTWGTTWAVGWSRRLATTWAGKTGPCPSPPPTPPPGRRRRSSRP